MSKDSSEISAEVNEPPNKLGRNKWWIARRKGEAKNFGPPWRVILTTLVVFLISQLIAALLIETVLALTKGTSSPTVLLDQSTLAQFFYVFFAEGLAAGFVFYILRVRGLKLGSIGWGRRPQWRDLSSAFLGFGAFYVLLIIVSVILTAIFPELKDSQPQNVGFNNISSSFDWILAFVALAILPPLGEETLIRGYLYSGLRASWRFLPAMLVTSLLFGAAHLQPGEQSAVWSAAVDTFVLSIVLVYLREKTGALYACVIVHGLNNVIAFGVHFNSMLF